MIKFNSNEKYKMSKEYEQNKDFELHQQKLYIIKQIISYNNELLELKRYRKKVYGDSEINNKDYRKLVLRKEKF